MTVYRTLKPGEWPSAMELWQQAFGPVGWVHESLDAGTTNRKLEHTLIAEQDGKIVSAVDVFIREMRDETGLPVLVGGIGSVATDESARRQGHSGKLLVDAIEMMEREGCGWSMLFTGTNHHYARYGWADVFWRRELGRYQGRESQNSEFEIESLGNQGPWPLEDLARIYASFNATRPLSHVRTKLYWDTAIKIRLERPERGTWIARLDGKIVAYLVASFEDEEGDTMPQFTEIGYLPGSEKAIEELMIAALGDFRGEVNVRLAHEAEVDAALSAILQDLKEEAPWGPMVRQISADWPVERIEALINLREARCWDLDNF